MINYLCITNDIELKAVLNLCYSILGENFINDEIYGYNAWHERMLKYNELLLYACENEKIVAAVLGRPENPESLILGFVTCDMEYRMSGITKELLRRFEINAKKLQFKYITLGANKNTEGFYEKCGYSFITKTNEQKIYQKFL